ncbi:MAG: hypothetical protein J6X18_00455 [Bacteroidales bacterium]|nr:hypothetical protein [Bacteroidales bacterium]
MGKIFVLVFFALLFVSCDKKTYTCKFEVVNRLNDVCDTVQFETEIISKHETIWTYSYNKNGRTIIAIRSDDLFNNGQTVWQNSGEANVINFLCVDKN